ncbi:uncharacterized protein [Leptinotarsa decemlineata]|uniref:uncharacterized protein n=1 Tax=Leptinotarsa decemlineata TaxID=7539 RepID=UPI003D3094B8
MTKMECDNVAKRSKKRPKTGRIQDVMKKVRLASHEQGPACLCKRLRCFEVTTNEQRMTILSHFNNLPTNNEQNSYLCSLISVTPVQRRRNRKSEEEAVFHDSVFSYKIRVEEDDRIVETSVCYKAFLSIHGISKGKLEHLQKALKNRGTAPKDKRGQHSSKIRSLPDSTYQHVFDHISSFKGRLSHYSLNDSKKLYLPEELNITKMFNMFKLVHPTEKISYETYRNIFNTKFNISFGYPRSDTCSTCDRFTAEVNRLRVQGTPEAAVAIRRLEIQNELHKRKAESFYNQKRSARRRDRTSNDFIAVAMDYQKNVYLPNIPTNDVYYMRQLSMYSFNIHVLGTAQSLFYTYPENLANKGSDEVCSFLFDFLMNHAESSIKHLHIFCDSAGGQNKNYSAFRFMHYIVHSVRRLDSIRITFPIRGHSYLECDKNMGLVNLKTRMELPKDYYELLEQSRTKPTPFSVIRVQQHMVKDWGTFFKNKFRAKCPFAIQEIREIYCTRDHPKLMYFRSTYNGAFSNSSIINNKKKKSGRIKLGENEFELPNAKYTETLPIKKEKFLNLQKLKLYCEQPEAADFYTRLAHYQ